MRYIALLRGINLGSHNRISMPELKTACEHIGLEEVITYVQSGNVIFTAKRQDSSKLTQQVKATIRDEFSCDVTVLLKTASEMARIVQGNPFITRAGIDPAMLHVTFLNEAPDQTLVASLLASLGGTDEWAIGGDHIYLYCPNGYGRTKLTNALFERKLKTVATTRNWKTVTALSELANA